MISIYLLYLIIFPIAVFVGIKREHRDGHVLVSKDDTKFLKGVSACFVIIAHSATWIDKLSGGMNRIVYIIFSQLGGIGVLIFFFVSGYGIHKNYSNRHVGWDYLWKRIKSVYIPYIIIKFSLLIVRSLIMGDIDFGLQKIVSILLIEDWFIYVILIQYVLFFLIRKFCGVRRILVYSLIADLVVSCLFIINSRPDGWFNALWLFTFGMCCSKYENEICVFFEKRKFIKIFFLFMLFGITGILFAINKGIGWANVFKPISGVFLCLGICGILREISFSSRSMIYFGERSMYMYIAHIGAWSMLDKMKNVIYRFWIMWGLTLLISEIMYQLLRFLLCNRQKNK